MVKNKDTWEQYKKYLRNLPLNGLTNIKNRLEYQLDKEEMRLRKQQLFEKTERELDFINEVIESRKDEAKN